MITIFPAETETLVLSLESDVVGERITQALDKPFVSDGIPKVIQGWVRGEQFQLTIRIRRQQFFMPLIKGVIEPTSKGSLVFLHYSIFPAMKAMLAFWSLVLPLISIPLALEYNNYWIIAGMVLFTVMMYAIAWANFQLHLKTTKQILHQLLN